MPSTAHELLIELFRRRPALAAELLTGALGMSLPAHQQARVEAGELPDLVPTEYRADAVVVLTAAETRQCSLWWWKSSSGGIWASA